MQRNLNITLVMVFPALNFSVIFPLLLVFLLYFYQQKLQCVCSAIFLLCSPIMGAWAAIKTAAFILPSIEIFSCFNQQDSTEWKSAQIHQLFCLQQFLLLCMWMIKSQLKSSNSDAASPALRCMLWPITCASTWPSAWPFSPTQMIQICCHEDFHLPHWPAADIQLATMMAFWIFNIDARCPIKALIKKDSYCFSPFAISKENLICDSMQMVF